MNFYVPEAMCRRSASGRPLEDTVKAVYKALKITEDYMAYEYEYIGHVLPEHIEFITAQELEERYPALTPREREHKAAREYGAIFIEQIGKKLASGNPMTAGPRTMTTGSSTAISSYIIRSSIFPWN